MNFRKKPNFGTDPRLPAMTPATETQYRLNLTLFISKIYGHIHIHVSDFSTREGVRGGVLELLSRPISIIINDRLAFSLVCLAYVGAHLAVIDYQPAAWHVVGLAVSATEGTTVTTLGEGTVLTKLRTPRCLRFNNRWPRFNNRWPKFNNTGSACTKETAGFRRN